MKKELTKALNLPSELMIEKIENFDKEIFVICKTKKRKFSCPKCKHKKTSGYDTVVNKKLHTVLNGKKVFLRIKKRRYECRKCRSVFTEKITGMHSQRTTDFFDQLVQEKSRNQDLASVARELGITSMTVANKQDLLALEKFQVPEQKEIYLGLDGKYLNGEDEIFVIGDVKEKQFFGVTKTNKITELEEVLKKNLIDKGKVVPVVTMDMSKTFKGVVTRLFPDVAIIVDKFHVIKYTNSVIDLCRIAVEKSVNERFNIKRLLIMKNKTIQKIKNKPKWKNKVKKFKELLQTNSELKILWDLKNRIHAFYQAKDLKQGEERFEGLIGFLDSYTHIHPEFQDLKNTLLNWKQEILNYFIYGLTNAFIEGLNNRIETLKRKRFGFRNKNRFIKTLLFAFLPITIFLQDIIYTH